MIAIWQRPSLDWADEDAAFELIGDPVVKRKVVLWNRTFTMSFQRFRARMAEITRANLAAVEGAIVAEWDDIPAGAAVLPIDDDDWFAPHAARAVEARLGAARLAVWPARTVEAPIDLGHAWFLMRRRLVPSTPPTWVCGTNNYAVIKAAGARPLATSHVSASRWVEAEGQSPGAVAWLDDPLSIANRNLGSQTTLMKDQPTITRRTLLVKYRLYRRLYHRAPPSGLEWSRPYLRQMAQLMSDVEVR